MRLHSRPGAVAASCVAALVIPLAAASAGPAQRSTSPIVYGISLACPTSHGCPAEKYNGRIDAIAKIGYPPKDLTNGDSDDKYPVFSPDHSQIGFVRDPVPGQDEIWVMNADGSNQRLVAHAPSLYADALWSWAPDGKRIAFDGDSPDGKGIDLYRINTDGTGLRRLTANADGLVTNNSTWSPNGKRIAFEWDDENSSADGIAVVRAAGGHLTQLCSNCDEPRWSPDGSRILYQSEKPGDAIPFGVNIVAPNGTEGWRYIHGKSGAASWSPDGTKIAYFKMTDTTTGEGHFYVMHADGVDRQELTSLLSSGGETWSPDGTKIAFLAGGGDTFSLYVIDADRTHLIRLSASVDSSANWSPDGTELVFLQSDHRGGDQVTIVGADGSGIKQLTKRDDSLSYDWPDW